MKALLSIKKRAFKPHSYLIDLIFLRLQAAPQCHDSSHRMRLSHRSIDPTYLSTFSAPHAHPPPQMRPRTNKKKHRAQFEGLITEPAPIKQATLPMQINS